MHKVSRTILHSQRILASTHTSKVQTCIAAIRYLDSPTFDPGNASITRFTTAYPDLAPILATPVTDPANTRVKLIAHLNGLFNNIHNHNLCPGKHSFITRVKAYLPSDRITLTALTPQDPSAPPITDPDLMAAETNRFWSALWAQPANTDHSHIRSYLNSYNKSIPTPHAPPPIDLTHIHSSLEHSKSTAAGPDGIPPSAYKTLSTFCQKNGRFDLSAHFLLSVAHALGRGDPAPDGFNHTLLRTPPKKSSQCKIDDTRPLQTPNGDNRLLSKSFLGATIEAFTAHLNLDQKGFLPGRDFKDHIRDLTNLYYSSLTKKQVAIILFVDYQKAFDSIDHSFIFQLLDHINLPRYHINFIKNLFHQIKAIPAIGPLTFLQHAFSIFRGTKQGCPFSPILFLLVLDTLIHRVSKNVKCTGRTFAMADDLAFFLPNIHALTSLAEEIYQYCLATGSKVHQGINGKSAILPTYHTPHTIALTNLRQPPLGLPPEVDSLPCRVCRVHDEQCFLCDSCNAPYHLTCITDTDTPPNPQDPSSQWFCPLCATISASRLSNVPITNKYTYLGITIGLDMTLNKIFAPVITSLHKRLAQVLPCRDIFRLHQRIIIANVFLQSLTSFHCSIYIPPPSVELTIASILSTWLRNKGRYALDLLTHNRKHVGLNTPLRHHHTQAIALVINSAGYSLNKSIDTPHQHAKPKHPHTCDSASHIKAAHKLYHFASNTHGTWTTSDGPRHNSASDIYKHLRNCSSTANLHKANLQNKIRNLITANTATDLPRLSTLTSNLIRNYSRIPAKVPDGQRVTFLMLLFNALTFKGRIRHWAGNADTLCIYCRQDSEDMTHVYFLCPVVNAAKTRLKSTVPYLSDLSLAAALLMEDDDFYHTLSPHSPGPEQNCFYFSFLGPIFLFNIAVWNSRKHITNTPHLDTDLNTRIITRTFWDLCTGNKDIVAAFPAYGQAIDPLLDLPKP
jgi:hypothetical protein